MAREVGTEGKLGGQAEVPGVAGTWKDLTDTVNSMAANLTARSATSPQVTTAVAQGDLSQKVSVDVKGETLELKSTINTMVDQLSLVRRRGHPRGPRGRHRGQARRPGPGEGRLRHLEGPHRQRQLHGRQPDQPGPQHRPGRDRGRQGRPVAEDHRRRARARSPTLDETLNTMVDQLSSFADEVTRVAREVGTEGSLGGQAQVKGVSGTWRDLTENVNFMAGNLTGQVRNIAQVTTAVAQGDLSQKITVDAKGEVAALEQTINTMVDQLSLVRRRGHPCGPRGRHRGPARRPGPGEGRVGHLERPHRQRQLHGRQPHRPGPQHRPGRHRGRPRRPAQKITVDAQGEILELKNTINTMVDQLSSFADEVTRVAREVGTEGSSAARPR